MKKPKSVSHSKGKAMSAADDDSLVSSQTHTELESSDKAPFPPSDPPPPGHDIRGWDQDESHAAGEAAATSNLTNSSDAGRTQTPRTEYTSDQLRRRMNALEAKVFDLESRVSALNAEKQTLQNRLSKLSTRCETYRATIENQGEQWNRVNQLISLIDIKGLSGSVKRVFNDSQLDVAAVASDINKTLSVNYSPMSHRSSPRASAAIISFPDTRQHTSPSSSSSQVQVKFAESIDDSPGERDTHKDAVKRRLTFGGKNLGGINISTSGHNYKRHSFGSLMRSPTEIREDEEALAQEELEEAEEERREAKERDVNKARKQKRASEVSKQTISSLERELDGVLHERNDVRRALQASELHVKDLKAQLARLVAFSLTHRSTTMPQQGVENLGFQSNVSPPRTGQAVENSSFNRLFPAMPLPQQTPVILRQQQILFEQQLQSFRHHAPSAPHAVPKMRYLRQDGSSSPREAYTVDSQLSDAAKENTSDMSSHSSHQDPSATFRLLLTYFVTDICEALKKSADVLGTLTHEWFHLQDALLSQLAGDKSVKPPDVSVSAVTFDLKQECPGSFQNHPLLKLLSHTPEGTEGGSRWVDEVELLKLCWGSLVFFLQQHVDHFRLQVGQWRETQVPCFLNFIKNRDEHTNSGFESHTVDSGAVPSPPPSRTSPGNAKSVLRSQSPTSSVARMEGKRKRLA